MAQQDKHKHAVTTMISYLERGKADSIKEALILYDREERERANREANNYMWQLMQQQLRDDRQRALNRMEEEQQKHNASMHERARERNEKIDDAIREIKDSLKS